MFVKEVLHLFYQKYSKTVILWIIFSAVQKFGISKNFNVFKNVLFSLKAAFVWSKIQKKVSF